MKHLVFAIIVIITSSSLYSTTLDTNKIEIKDTAFATHALYLGVLAPFYSIGSYNYDYRFSNNFVVRVGIAYIYDKKLDPQKTLQYGIFPAWISGGNWATELGGGSYYDAVEDSVHIVGIFGIRYQKGESGLLFRVGFYPTFGRLHYWPPFLFTGFSIGYAF